jgi:hypothetical protein
MQFTVTGILFADTKAIVLIVITMLQVVQGSNGILGVNVLKSRGFFTEAKWYWIGAGALLGYVIVFNILFTIALSYLKRNSEVLE